MAGAQVVRFPMQGQTRPCPAGFTDPWPRVLLLDPSPLRAVDLAYTLSDAGLQVVGPALSADEALDLLVGETPAVALLSLDLGEEALRPVVDRLHDLRVAAFAVPGSSTSPRHRASTCRLRTGSGHALLVLSLPITQKVAAALRSVLAHPHPKMLGELGG